MSYGEPPPFCNMQCPYYRHINEKPERDSDLQNIILELRNKINETKGESRTDATESYVSGRVAGQCDALEILYKWRKK